MARFQHRFVVVTETKHIVKDTSFSYRSYADKRDAMGALDAVEKKRSMFKRAYIVDQQNPGSVLLPSAKGGK